MTTRSEGRFQNNRNAAMFAGLALLILLPAMRMPFISLSTLGRSREASLLSGVRDLLFEGHVFLGALLGLACVVFPIAKLAAILLATSALVPLSLRAREGLCGFARATGKYSLLDLLVVAVLIILFKFGGVAKVEARPGTWLFGLAILLSIAASACTCFKHLEGETT